MSLKTKENKTNLVQVRLDIKTKTELELILDDLGLTTSQAILMYIKQIILKKKIPFELSTLKRSKYDDSELTQDEFNKLQAFYVKELDKDEEIPPFHEKNARPFTYTSKKKK
jgi:addiction module RelB/DinJ family antitoxin